ncbi:MAG: methyltransferase domain-containing protein [Candidatus Eiseniibacteriota bacterium]
MDGLPLLTQVADAEEPRFTAGEFNVVLSTFGVMFAPNQERAAIERVRLTSPGGRIDLANWTPESLIGQPFRVIGRLVPPPASLLPPELVVLPETYNRGGSEALVAPGECLEIVIQRG